MTQPFKTQQIIGLFGESAGKKLIGWLDPCCPSYGGINIYNSDGSLLANRTVETDGKNLLFSESASNIYFGITTSPFGTNRAYVNYHSDGNYAFILTNKSEDVDLSDGSKADVLGFVTLNTTTGEFSGLGTYKSGSKVGTLSYYNNLSTVTEIRHNAQGIQIMFNGAVIIKIDTTSGYISTPNLPVYANNAAAVGGGLSAGYWYQTPSGDLKIVV